MTTLDTLREAVPDYARDLKLNLGSVLSTTRRPGIVGEADLGGRSRCGDSVSEHGVHA